MWRSIGYRWLVFCYNWRFELFWRIVVFIFSKTGTFRQRFNERVELINGRIFKISPVPSEQHHKISYNITSI